jgi:hypothetical protein
MHTLRKSESCHGTTTAAATATATAAALSFTMHYSAATATATAAAVTACTTTASYQYYSNSSNSSVMYSSSDRYFPLALSLAPPEVGHSVLVDAQHTCIVSVASASWLAVVPDAGGAEVGHTCGPCAAVRHHAPVVRCL